MHFMDFFNSRVTMVRSNNFLNNYNEAWTKRMHPKAGTGTSRLIRRTTCTSAVSSATVLPECLINESDINLFSYFCIE